MLARPEIGTREHILLWLDSKDPNEFFYWRSVHGCACGQYSGECLGDRFAWAVNMSPRRIRNSPVPKATLLNLALLNAIAFKVCDSYHRVHKGKLRATFGTLAIAARARFAEC